MNKLTIIKQQGHVSVQDLGRFTCQHLGFSAGGVADEYAFLSGNYLLGNAKNDAALEIVFGQISLKANDLCHFVLTGADCRAEINGQPIKHWQNHTLNKNDVLTLNAPKQGLYTYLCVAGGIQSDKVLSSKSNLPAAVANKLTANVLNVKNSNEFNLLPSAKTHCQQPQQQPKSELNFNLASEQKPLQYYCFNEDVLTIRFIPHSDWQQLSTAAQQIFTEQNYQLSATSNKMGYRFEGNTAINLPQITRLSKPVTLGAIQLPTNGMPIVLMKDRQTIGGYPVLGTVIQVDIPRLAQHQAGQNIRFVATSLEQAQALYCAFFEKFKQSDTN